MKTHLVIHHSGTVDSDTLSWPAIRRVHMERGWIDVGYHYGIEWHDRGAASAHYEMLVGRPISARAAGEPKEGMNRKGIHVCFIGDFDKAVPEMSMWRYAMPHLAGILDAFGIPIENVIGHREIADVGSYKHCPGKNWDMSQFRDLLGGQP